MAADVSARLRMMKDRGDGKDQRDLITRDLLGGCDLGAQDRRLDLMPEKAYLERRGSDVAASRLHDLNFPPPAPLIATQAITEDSVALDLRLVSLSSASAAPEYQSVCTLEKVKSALERAERAAGGRRRLSDGSPSSPSSSTTSSSAKRRNGEEEEGLDVWDSSGGTAMMAAGCPGCLLYVLISRENPRCPRCDSHVPIPALPKKPKIDLNSTSP
ncbi:hypothetical protein J5N97_028411 [Dioscorea zingiberensis]|uniref:GIR1-like zinc ribbon domain-containing protein n=1 Tax=Dioscorea zingiberensis TaxID=325984 RepID=A0A9D5H4S3_9LILI|nr:hypothetical protein J5N97_028411 [Dioscorea zingiberensis]